MEQPEEEQGGAGASPDETLQDGDEPYTSASPASSTRPALPSATAAIHCTHTTKNFTLRMFGRRLSDLNNDWRSTP
ncbi:hypothetical protein J4Q44_G00088670 [Coregonus suidteri]|uniref:Uncharacterized protein n=1 Tax=Coregonus suidteri TaxID=861788 RepID=A0AAN8QWX8_9TELE